MNTKSQPLQSQQDGAQGGDDRIDWRASYETSQVEIADLRRQLASRPAIAPQGEADHREFLGKLVRAEWMDWARENPLAKAKWLTPWDQLTEPEREVDRRIGERIYNMAIGAIAPQATPAAVDDVRWLLKEARAGLRHVAATIGYKYAEKDLARCDAIEAALACPGIAPQGDELGRLRELAGCMYAGPAAVHDLPECWLDALLAASQGEMFSCERLIPYEAATADSIKSMVNRFLGWRLPDDFSPDAGVSFKPNTAFPHAWPTGTNLLTADQAKAMFEYCAALAAPPAEVKP